MAETSKFPNRSGGTEMELSYRTRELMMRILPVRFIEKRRIRMDFCSKEPPVLVLQNGKVGSSSIYEGLKVLPNPVYHIHTLSPENISRAEEYYLSRNEYVRHHLVVSRILSDMYFRNEIPFTYIVCSVREPIGRRVSSFFENYTVTHPDLLNYSGEIFVKKATQVLQDIFTNDAQVIRDYVSVHQHPIFTRFACRA